MRTALATTIESVVPYQVRFTIEPALSLSKEP